MYFSIYFKIVELNGKVYFISNQWFQEYSGEVITNSEPTFFSSENFEIYNYKIQVYNNELYVLNNNNSQEPGILSISGNQVSFNPFSIQVFPPSIDLYIPNPPFKLFLGFPSPVPTQITLGLDC